MKDINNMRCMNCKWYAGGMCVLLYPHGQRDPYDFCGKWKEDRSWEDVCSDDEESEG